MKLALGFTIGMFAAGFGASSALAEVTPRAGNLDARVRYAQWVDGQVYRVQTQMGRVTSVEFGPDEQITSVIAGDTVSFNFDAVPGGSAFVMKPTVSGAATNINVYTNKRQYYFEVSESPRAQFSVVRFTYPRGSGSSTPANRQIVRGPSNHDYGANIINAASPTQVWDDGAFTYFKFRRNGEMPAIFKVTTGQEITVNSTTMADGTVRVTGTSPFWVLRLGQVETTVGMMKAVRLVK